MQHIQAHYCCSHLSYPEKEAADYNGFLFDRCIRGPLLAFPGHRVTLKVRVMLFLFNILFNFQSVGRKAWRPRVGHGPQAREIHHAGDRLGTALKQAGGAFFLAAILATTAYADSRSDLAQARHDLAISEQVLARVSDQADKARSDPATSPQERQRIDEYLDRVRELVELNRKRVRSLEESLPLGQPGLPGSGFGSGGVSPATTSTEEVAALDAKLSGSLSEFDKLLLEEARKAQARAPSSRSAGAYAGGSSNGKGEGKGASQSGAKESRGDKPSASADGDQASQRAGTGPGSPGGRIDGTDPGAPGATAAVPPDVGDGNDDDIVARQIRKAAEAETDPELRKKLWDEYRKYKQGTKG